MLRVNKDSVILTAKEYEFLKQREEGLHLTPVETEAMVFAIRSLTIGDIVIGGRSNRKVEYAKALRQVAAKLEARNGNI